MRGFRITAQIFQFLLAVLAGTAPVWITDFFSQGSKYRYMVGDPIVFGSLLILFFSFLFFPQILWVLSVALRHTSALGFLSVYNLRKGRVATMCLFGLGLTILVLGLSNAASGWYQLAFSFAREFKYAELVNRGRLVEMASLEEQKAPGASLPVLKQLIALYPEDNYYARYVESLENARKLSDDITAFGDRFQAAGRLLLASETYGAATRVWPHNTVSRQKYGMIEASLFEAKPKFLAAFETCVTQKSVDADVLAEIYKLMLRNVPASDLGSVSMSKMKKLTKVICSRALSYKSGEDFFEDLSGTFVRRSLQ